jgi:streptogramin lyase
MRLTFVLLASIAAAAAIALVAAGGDVRAQTQLALAGVVSSTAEGAMEGVIVSARRAGSPIVTSVVSDERGRYGFPTARLGPGSYQLSIRAAGYELPTRTIVDVAGARTATADLRLRAVRDVATQLTDAEWVLSMPGTAEQKRALLDCNGCHSLQRVVYSSWSTQEFLSIIPRMASYVNQSTAVHPQRRYAAPPGAGMSPKALEDLASYLATVNLHDRAYWSYEPKALPRPKGAATRVIYTEYDLPRAIIEPHDVYIRDGIVWYSDFGEQYLGKLDPATGKVTEYPLPVLKKGWPEGTLDIQPDNAGNIWISGMYQGGLMAFDPKTETVHPYPLQQQLNGATAQQSMVMPNHMDVDGKVWTNNQDAHQVLKLDVATGTYEVLGPFKDPSRPERTISGYGILADSQNNGYFLDMGGEGQAIVRVDAKTGAVRVFETPTKRSRARRGRIDAHDVMTFAEYGANQVAQFDTKTGQFREFKMAIPWTNPYDAYGDRNGDIWTGSMWTDRISRVDTRTGRVIDYLLPRFTNIRRVFVDESTNPVTFWTSNNHGASIIKLEAAP